MIGKRKRDVKVARRASAESEQGPTNSADASNHDQDLFRRYFESTFEPLEKVDVRGSPQAVSEDEDDEISLDDESDWAGLSDEEANITAVHVVEHRDLSKDSEDHEDARQHYKSFMTSRPPKAVEAMAQKLNPAENADDQDDSEALNLKHDLDLQRLLKESHLLEQARTSSVPGSHRHKAIDMRMQSLGSKDSLFHQEKMPLSHRRGITAKAASREAMRRKEARENGIILERAAANRKSSGRRERAVDVPAVGRFRGGTLQLSKRDVLNIQGPGRSGNRRKRGGR